MLTQLNDGAGRSNPFTEMLTKAQALHTAGFLEFAVIQCHITIDYFISSVLETNFMPKLNSIRDHDQKIYALFLKAIWESDDERKFLSFTDKFGKYISVLGFDFAGYTAQGGRQFYKELKQLNEVRNGIVHSRYFISDLASADVLNIIQLCKDVIDLFRNQFNATLDLSPKERCSTYAFKENDLVVRVQEKHKTTLQKTTDLHYEVDLTFFAEEHNCFLSPIHISTPSPRFRAFVLQVCGLDYVRYGTDKTDKTAPSGQFEPDWQNGNLFSLKLNLSFLEPARNFESILVQKQPSIKSLISKLVAEKYERMLHSWECLGFVDRIGLARLFESLFDLSKAEPSDTDSDLTQILVQTWKMPTIANSSAISFKSLHEISQSKDRRVVLMETTHAAEISLIARAADKLDFLEENIIVILPSSQPRHALVGFVENFLRLNGVECAATEATSELRKKIQTSHTDRQLAKYSDYALIATDAPFMEYVAEMINGRQHLNGDHWFSKQLLALVNSLSSPMASEILYFIEKINETLEGRQAHFSDIDNFCKEMSRVLTQVGAITEKESLLSASESDFPPGFSQSDYRVEEILKLNR